MYGSGGDDIHADHFGTEQGDLSENAEYRSARRAFFRNESSLAEASLNVCHIFRVLVYTFISMETKVRYFLYLCNYSVKEFCVLHLQELQTDW